MPMLTWDESGKKFYETGVDRGVLYPRNTTGTYEKGVAWSGLTTVSESPSGAEANALYADNQKYLSLISAEEFSGTIEAYMYPDEFTECDGSKEIAPGVFATQQTRKHFGFSYRTLIGNDSEGTDKGYKIHLVYDATASPSEKSNSTVNDSPEALTLSWEFTTTPVSCSGMKPTAHVVIDSTKADPTALAALEKILYGDTDTEARLPLPDELATIFADSAVSG